MKYLILFLTLLVSGCGSDNNGFNEAVYPVKDLYSYENIDTGKPKVLVIGSSVSQGYSNYLRLLLNDYDLYHNEGRSRSTINGVSHIDEWLAEEPTWHSITFTFGNHDIHDSINTSDQDFFDNLTIIARKVKAATARPVYILGTDIPEGSPNRTNERLIEIQNIAIQVMQNEGIPVIDLYGYGLTITHLHDSPTGNHYTHEGYKSIASWLFIQMRNLYGIQ